MAHIDPPSTLQYGRSTHLSGVSYNPNEAYYEGPGGLQFL